MYKMVNMYCKCELDFLQLSNLSNSIAHVHYCTLAPTGIYFTAHWFSNRLSKLSNHDLVFKQVIFV